MLTRDCHFWVKPAQIDIGHGATFRVPSSDNDVLLCYGETFNLIAIVLEAEIGIDASFCREPGECCLAGRWHHLWRYCCAKIVNFEGNHLVCLTNIRMSNASHFRWFNRCISNG